jgi:hypothetical protein
MDNDHQNGLYMEACYHRDHDILLLLTEHGRGVRDLREAANVGWITIFHFLNGHTNSERLAWHLARLTDPDRVAVITGHDPEFLAAATYDDALAWRRRKRMPFRRQLRRAKISLAAVGRMAGVTRQAVDVYLNGGSDSHRIAAAIRKLLDDPELARAVRPWPGRPARRHLEKNALSTGAGS